MLVHRRVTPSIKFAGTHLYTWVEWGTVRVKCLAYEYNAMSQARSRTQAVRSGVECTNHEATAPPKFFKLWVIIISKIISDNCYSVSNNYYTVSNSYQLVRNNNY